MKNILQTLEILANTIAIAAGKAIMHLLEEVEPGRVSASWRIEALAEITDWWIRTYPTAEAFNNANKDYAEKTAACLESQRNMITHICLIILGE